MNISPINNNDSMNIGSSISSNSTSENSLHSIKSSQVSRIQPDEFEKNTLHFKSLIRTKQLGQELSEEQIKFWIDGTISQSIPYYQQTALLMAICFQKMSIRETAYLTNAMAESGKYIEYQGLQGFKVDKHSTGGIGDKTTLLLAPLMASLGVKVPNISGRALGHTGGTVDKVESIPGFRTNLNFDEMRECIKNAGGFITGQTDQLAPADKIIYSLRDVTETTGEISLITSSILSKKFAEGLGGLTIDVKCGSGALIQDYEGAYQLANYLVQTANTGGLLSEALITRMDYPLGEFAGNSCEVYEALQFMKPGSEYQKIMDERIVFDVEATGKLVLKGGVQSPKDNLIFVVMGLALNMIESTGVESEVGFQKIKDQFKNGEVLKKFKEMVAQQGGLLSKLEVDFKNNVLNKLMKSEKEQQDPCVFALKATQVCKIKHVDSKKLGNILAELGSGRKVIQDRINYDISLNFLAFQNQVLNPGDIICQIYHPNPQVLGRFNNLEQELFSAFQFTQDLEYQDNTPLIYDIVSYSL